MPILGRDKALMLETDLPQERFQEASDNAKPGASSLSPALRAAIFKSLKEHQQRGEAAPLGRRNMERWTSQRGHIIILPPFLPTLALPLSRRKGHRSCR